MEDNRYAIRHVVGKTGLSAHVIRIWERRYQAIEPSRTATGHRYYSDDDVTRLKLLSQLTESGYRIHKIASLTTAELKNLVEEAQETIAIKSQKSLSTYYDKVAEQSYEKCMAAVSRFDSQLLAKELHLALVHLSLRSVMQDVVVPLVHQIGERWQCGSLEVAHEHMATQVIEDFLREILGYLKPSASKYVIVITTPKGEGHQIGALLATAVALQEGWKAVFCGTDLPGKDIRKIVESLQAKVLGLSVVCPGESGLIHQTLDDLKENLSKDVQLVMGGRSARLFQSKLIGAGGMIIEDLDGFRHFLRQWKNSKSDT